MRPQKAKPSRNETGEPRSTLGAGLSLSVSSRLQLADVVELVDTQDLKS
jgi:hypothetical protein